MTTTVELPTGEHAELPVTPPGRTLPLAAAAVAEVAGTAAPTVATADYVIGSLPASSRRWP
ncbi:hypothetical protein ACIF83_05365 [Streptomyces sp. NPDC085866]|uniref:hypothetical protein n=1 Tax=Streptomyces sp. NPDC085866 TaxID=3365736 RepID=UPI0037D5D77C